MLGSDSSNIVGQALIQHRDSADVESGVDFESGICLDVFGK